MKVLHIITGLTQGGAEQVLYRLISFDRNNEHVVISLTNKGTYGVLFEELGIEVHCLNMTRGTIKISGLLRLARLIKYIGPDVVHNVMYHANLIGGIISRLLGIKAVVWVIHCANLDPNLASLSTRLSAKLCAYFSSWLPALIVFDSKYSANFHQRLGYNSDIFYVVHNGIDLNIFKPQSKERDRIRSLWNLSPEQPLLGMVARWDPYKDHQNLLQAFFLLLKRGLNVSCVMVGENIDQSNTTLMNSIYKLGLNKETNVKSRWTEQQVVSKSQKNLILAGSRSDIPAVMNALDVNILSSVSESFGLVVAEAMACGTTCVVTNSEGPALIVGETGWVVPPRNSEALANAIESAINMLNSNDIETVRKKCRQRIEANFSIKNMVRDYNDIWSKACQIEGIKK